VETVFDRNVRGLGVLEKSNRDRSFLMREGRVSRWPSICKDIGYSAEADSAQGKSGLWHLRGAEGDRLTERSEERKLPQLQPRALAAQGMLITLFGGASGGMQGGPRRGRSPITGPALLRAAQASQLRRKAIPRAWRAEKFEKIIQTGQMLHAGQASQSPSGKKYAPEGLRD
jgi:hypothetical protein